MDYRHVTTEVLGKTRELLQCARDLITPIDKWVQGTLATDKDGNIVFVKDADACCFCAIGALHRCNPDYRVNRTYDPRTPVFWAKAALDDLVDDDIMYFNDRPSGDLESRGRARRHQLVLKKFDQALKRVDAVLKKRGVKTDATV